MLFFVGYIVDYQAICREYAQYVYQRYLFVLSQRMFFKKASDPL